MAIYEYSKEKLLPLAETTFAQEKVLERQDLQRLIAADPSVLSPDLLIIAESFSNWEDSYREIDLLGLTKDARLVVVELKRDDQGAHAELQALRYAAMVSTMTFDQAVAAYGNFLQGKNIQKDAKAEILNFLEWSDPKEDEFANDLQIILASADFSKELVTTVLWLNERDLDICCVRLKPYKLDGKLLVNVEQVVPLPEAGDYQIRLQEQREQRREARRSSRDFSQYKFNGESYGKRRLVLAVVKASVMQSPPKSYEELKLRFPGRLGGNCDVVLSDQEIRQRPASVAEKCYFMEKDEIIQLASNESIAVSTQWGNNFEMFLGHAKKLGFQIEKVS